MSKKENVYLVQLDSGAEAIKEGGNQEKSDTTTKTGFSVEFSAGF